MKKIGILFSALLLSSGLMAQTVDDALLFSHQKYTSTARSAAMGGAFGALGGDFSSLSINPAGLGVYRSTEFTFSPSLELTRSKNRGISEDKYSLSIGNIGYVANIRPRFDKGNGWKDFTIGVGYNRLNNFKSTGIMKVENSPNSQIDYFQFLADGNTPDQLDGFFEGLAFNTFLIDTVPGSPTQYNRVLFEGDRVNQTKILDEKGHLGEFTLSFGANYNHKLYLGATIGIQDINYESTSEYTEQLVLPEGQSPLDDYTFTQRLKISGVGINLKIGGIYKATEELRLGLAIHTPTFWDVSEDYKTEIKAHYAIPPVVGDDRNNFIANTRGDTDYKYESPMKAIASVAYLFGKKALLSLDYEWIDYSSGKYSSGPWGENYYGTTDNPGVNDQINTVYQSTGNLRLGGEYRLNSLVNLRAGYAHFGSPYKTSDAAKYDQYSLGWGFRQNGFFFDMAYIYNTMEENYDFYPNSQISKLDRNNHQVRMTFGFKF